MPEPEFVSAREAARLLGVSDTAIRKRIASGSIYATKDGSAWRIPQSEVERLLQEREPRAPTPNPEPRTSGCEPRTEPANPNVRNPVDDLIVQERGALATEVEVLRSKLTSAERQANALRTDLDRTQDQLDSALESVRSLTDEVKGLTAVIHSHRALPSPAGWLRGVIRQLVTLRV